MDISTYIKRMNQLYGNEQLASSNPLNIPAHMQHQMEGGQLTPEEFYQNQSIPITERPLTGAEGGRVYNTRKYLQGGRVGLKPGGLVEPGVTHYATTYADKKTKRYLTLKDAVSTKRYEQIKFANPEMSEAKLEKAYKKLTFNQKNGLIYESKDGSYKNRSGMINPTKSKVSEYSGRIKTLKNFKIVEKEGIINPETKKAFTQDEWFKIKPTKRTYYLNLAQDYEGTREKQRIKYQELADEGKIKVQGYNKTPIALRGERNGLLRFLRTAADEGNPNYKIIKQGGEIIGVYDKKTDTVWRGVLKTDNYKGKNHKSIHEHPDYKKVHNPLWKTQGGKPGLFELAKQFKFTSPNETLGTYFAKYGKVPSYSDMYNFLTRPESKATKRGYNALEKHHFSLIKGSPTKNIQLTLHDKNREAENLWKGYNDPNNPNYKNQTYIDKELKRINARLKVGNKFLGAAELTGEQALGTAKRETVRLFKERLKTNPNLVKEMAKSSTFKNWIKKFPCRKSNGGVVDIKCHIAGMRHEKNLLNTGKGTKAMANKFIEGTSLASKGKFGNASRLFLKGTVVGDLLFEGGYAAYNYTQGKDAADIWRHSWYSFMDPKFWKDGKYIGWVKDADQAKLYTRKDGSIMPEIKRYVDNANLVQKHLDLYNNVFSAGLQDPTIQVGAAGEASKKVTQAKTDLDLFNEEIYKKGGMNKIIGELERDYKTYSEREEVMAGREEQAKKDRFEELKAMGAFPKDREFYDMSDAERKRKYDQRYEAMEAANPLKSVFSSPEMMADYFVSDDMAQEFLKEYFPLAYGHVSSKRMLPSAKQDVFRILREDPEYNQEILSMASAYDPATLGTQYNQGGRVGFKAGGIDKGRRAFMKWLAALTGAGVAAGTGILKFGKTIGKGKTAIKAGDTIVQGTQGMPDWFIPLINRITKEGTDVTKKLSTVEREIVHSKKIAQGEEVTVYQNLDTGNVRVEYQSVHSEVPIQMEYKAPEIIESGKYKGQKTNPEFSAVESEPKWEAMGPDDADLTFEGENVVGRVEDLTTDTSKLKEFGKNKKLTIKEQTEAKKKQDYRKSLEHDTQTQAEYLEGRYGPGRESDVGMDEFGNLVDEYGEIID